MTIRQTEERQDIAQRRLRRVLHAQTVACARTLEQKISDAGPNPMRVDPHILTDARKELEQQGVISTVSRGSMRWYHLTSADQADVTARLAQLEPIHEALREDNFGKRLGQTLEIAVYRALLTQPELQTFGGYLDLDAHNDSRLYTKEEPPSSISGRTHRGRLDFLVSTRAGHFAGIEIKNVREWMYPNRDEVRELLAKCTTLDVVPVLIARRIPYVTFKLLTACGAIVHQTYNQLFPNADSDLAAKAKDKTLLGYHDIRVGNAPDARLTKFAVDNLPQLIDKQRAAFDGFKDLLHGFGTKSISYAEFAARVRRRLAGTNEQGDWD
jgi:hypothetical protein